MCCSATWPTRGALPFPFGEGTQELKSERKVDHSFLSRTNQTGLDLSKINPLELL